MPALWLFIIIVIFVAGCYYGGNAVLQTFRDDLRERLMSSLFGVLLWCALAMLVVIFGGIYAILVNSCS